MGISVDGSARCSRDPASCHMPQSLPSPVLSHSVRAVLSSWAVPRRSAPAIAALGSMLRLSWPCHWPCFLRPRPAPPLPAAGIPWHHLRTRILTIGSVGRRWSVIVEWLLLVAVPWAVPYDRHLDPGAYANGQVLPNLPGMKPTRDTVVCTYCLYIRRMRSV